MPTQELRSLTLEKALCFPKKTLNFNGLDFAWEVGTYAQDFENSKSNGGIFDLSDHVILQIEGKDSEDYLQRMTTVQFKILDVKKVVHGAFLTGKGGVIALGIFRKLNADTFQFLISHSNKKRVLEHIEQFHFAEQLAVTDLSTQRIVFGCWSEEGRLAKALGIDPLIDPLQIQRVKVGSSEICVWKDVRRNSLFWVEAEREVGVLWIKSCLSAGHIMLGRRLFEFFRLQAGVPWVGRELSDKDIILEANFDEAVARNKGCYPGQEVVERIFTYGQVNQKLQRVIVRGETCGSFVSPISFFQDSKEVGELVSFENSPNEVDVSVGLMWVKKIFWNSPSVWLSSSGLKATLVC